MTSLRMLECPACGANLNFAGGSAVTVTCGYCGKVSEVPPELRAPAAPPPLDRAALTAAVYARLRVGNQAGAVQAYMEAAQVSYDEAEAAVQRMQQYGLDDAAGQPPPPDIASLDLSDPEAVRAKIKELARAGYLRLAVEIYSRVYAVEAKEAYRAVEVIARGETPPAPAGRAAPPASKKKKRGFFGF